MAYGIVNGPAGASRSSGVSGSGISIVPFQTGGLTYNSKEQSPVWSNYDTEKLTLGGVTKSTNAGTYIATFTPKEGYTWMDGTTGAKEAPWTIAKAPGNLTAGRTDMIFDVFNLSETINIICDGDGAISVKVINEDIATVELFGTELTITAIKKGYTGIILRSMEDDNHTVSEFKVIHVHCDIPSSVLEENDIKYIVDAAKSGTAKNFWSVGDTIPIQLEYGYDVGLGAHPIIYAYIIGFNHNPDIEGNNTIHFQLGKTEDGTDIAITTTHYGSGSSSSSGTFHMILQGSNAGGWEGTSLRKNDLNKTFFSAFPTEWQNAMKNCPKYTNNIGQKSSSVSVTEDKLWLLSEFEVFGEITRSTELEQNFQKQYSYYANGNSKIKYRSKSLDTTAIWWLRSPAFASSGFCCVLNDGLPGVAQQYMAYGLSACFAVG